MPRTKSVKKTLRRSKRRREKNLERKNKMKTVVREYKKLVAAGKIEEAKKFLPKVYKTVDKMAKVDFIKKNKAGRIKSKLSRKLNSKG